MERTYVFNQDGNGGNGGSKFDIMAMLPNLMGSKGVDPGLLALLNQGRGSQDQWGGSWWFIWNILSYSLRLSSFHRKPKVQLIKRINASLLFSFQQFRRVVNITYHLTPISGQRFILGIVEPIFYTRIKTDTFVCSYRSNSNIFAFFFIAVIIGTNFSNITHTDNIPFINFRSVLIS